jgi:hypothetical protein
MTVLELGRAKGIRRDLTEMVSPQAAVGSCAIRLFIRRSWRQSHQKRRIWRKGSYAISLLIRRGSVDPAPHDYLVAKYP